MNDPITRFTREVEARVAANGRNLALRSASQDWLVRADEAKYEYNFSWLGRPVIQYPQDLVALQELIWRIQPGLIVETGVAHGGMTLFYASMLALLGGPRAVVGIDVDIRAHNRRALESHPLFDPERVMLLEGSSTAPEVVARVHAIARDAAGGPVLVCLDANHSHAHVLDELRSYAELVGRGSYIVVFDTSIATIPGDYPDRPWGAGDNPMTAVEAFLRESSRFEVDEAMSDKLLLSSAPRGFLRCVADPEVRS